MKNWNKRLICLFGVGFAESALVVLFMHFDWRAFIGLCAAVVIMVLAGMGLVYKVDLAKVAGEIKGDK